MKMVLMVMVVGIFFSGCTSSSQRAVIHPGAHVVARAELTQASGYDQVLWQPGVDRLYRVGDSWVGRYEASPSPIWMTAPARKLVAGDEAKGSISLQPAPLAAELAEELARMKELVARNREAMEQMRTATERLAAAAQELVTKNKELAERWPANSSKPELERVK